MYSRYPRRIWAAWSPGKKIGPARIVGPTGWSRNSKRGDDPEVPAPAAQTPEELRVLVLAGVDEPAVGGHEVGRDEVVAGQAVLAHQPADPAAEREPGDAGRRDEATGHRQPEGLRLVVELSPGRAALGDDALGVRVDPDALHRRQVDDDPAVGGGEPGQAVSTTANGDLELLAARELDGGDDVGDARAANDERRTPVDHPVPDGPSRVVAGSPGRSTSPRMLSRSSWIVASPRIVPIVVSS